MSSILPKNELENVNFCPSLLGQKFFIRFLGELKKPKKPFRNYLTFSNTAAPNVLLYPLQPLHCAGPIWVQNPCSKPRSEVANWTNIWGNHLLSRSFERYSFCLLTTNFTSQISLYLFWLKWLQERNSTFFSSKCIELKCCEIWSFSKQYAVLSCSNTASQKNVGVEL